MSSERMNTVVISRLLCPFSRHVDNTKPIGSFLLLYEFSELEVTQVLNISWLYGPYTFVVCRNGLEKDIYSTIDMVRTYFVWEADGWPYLVESLCGMLHADSDQYTDRSRVSLSLNCELSPCSKERDHDRLCVSVGQAIQTSRIWSTGTTVGLDARSQREESGSVNLS